MLKRPNWQRYILTMKSKINPVCPSDPKSSSLMEDYSTKPYRKKHIPIAFREQIWLQYCGRVFEHKCTTSWCKNQITVWDFQAGHNIPESRGGPLTPDNLVPICCRCNSSMGNRYTFNEWNSLKDSTFVKAVKFTCCW
jgi:hypothetical protein